MSSRTKEKPENVAYRVREYKERMKEKGYLRVEVWIPKKFKELLKEFVEKLKGK